MSSHHTEKAVGKVCSKILEIFCIKEEEENMIILIKIMKTGRQ